MSAAGVFLATTPRIALVEAKQIALVAVIVVAALSVCWIVMRVVLREAAKASNALGAPVRDDARHAPASFGEASSPTAASDLHRGPASPPSRDGDAARSKRADG